MTTSTSTTTNGKQMTKSKPPCVLWAQRADRLFVTIELEDCQNPEIKLEKEKLIFKGKSDSIQQDADHTEHEVTIEFFKPIKVDESKHSVRARGTEFVIIKEEEAWWPRLLKDSTKRHWLKVDFPKWKDEDDSEDEMGAPGMGGMGGMGGFGGGQPDLSDLMQQFGGMSGNPDMGAFGGDDEEEGDESDDDETEQKLPDLE